MSLLCLRSLATTGPKIIIDQKISNIKTVIVFMECHMLVKVVNCMLELCLNIELMKNKIIKSSC